MLLRHQKHKMKALSGTSPHEVWEGPLLDKKTGRTLKVRAFIYHTMESRGQATNYKPAWAGYLYAIDDQGNEFFRGWTSRRKYEEEYRTQFLPQWKELGWKKVKGAQPPYPMAKSGKAVTCYGLGRGRGWQQEWYESASGNAGVRARELRKLGYKVSVESMGPQVTRVGKVNMTLLTVRDLGYDDILPPPDRVERL